MRYALVTISTGVILERRDFPVAPAQPNPVKDVRWLLDEPPAISSWQQATAVQPVANAGSATEVSYIVADRPLEEVKAEKRAAIDLKRDYLGSLGVSVTIGLQTFVMETTNVLVLVKLNGLASGAIAAKQKGVAKTFTITDPDHIDRTFSVDEMISIGEQVQEKMSDHHATARTHRNAVNAMTTAQEVVQYDYSGGW